MHKFTDMAGREWVVNITIGALADIKAGHGFDLVVIFRTGEGLSELMMANPEALAGVLWQLVEPQARAAGVDAKAFHNALDGKALEAAVEAVLRSTAALFPRSAIGGATGDRVVELLRRMDDEVVKSFAK